MYRTRKIQISNKHELYEYCRQLAFGSARLYNRANYLVRQYATAQDRMKKGESLHPAQQEAVTLVESLTAGTKYHPSGAWLTFTCLDYIFKVTKDHDYYSLPAQVNQQILKLLVQDYKSFFAGMKAYRHDPSGFTGKPRLPRYKGELGTAVLTNQICKVREERCLRFPKTQICLDIGPVEGKLKCVRIKPENDIFVVEAVLELPGADELRSNEEILRELRERSTPARTISIDPGLDNLCAVTNNFGETPILISGKILKSVNQYYNKESARLRSEASRCNEKKITKRMKKLSRKRNNRIRDYMHKASRCLADYCEVHKVEVVVFGHNRMQKQKIGMGKANNQAFVNIPFNMLMQMLAYKLEEKGITFAVTEESYTSKADYLALDAIPEYGKAARRGEISFSGKRVKRGLYVHYDGTLSNADINGAANIMRKVFPNVPMDGWDRGLLDTPVKKKIA